MRPSTLVPTLLIACGLAAGAAAAEEPTILVRPADPPAAPEVAAMRHWHGRWALALHPVLAAWQAAGRDLERWYYRGNAPGCRALARTLASVEPADLTPAPEYGLTRDVGALLDRLEQGAEACVAGRYFEASYELGEARGAYLGLVRRLRRYGLEP